MSSAARPPPYPPPVYLRQLAANEVAVKVPNEVAVGGRI